MSSRAEEAVRRALDGRQRDAQEEVERILAAAVGVMQRMAPDTPRVGDIVAAAGTSNKTFYRYFQGKEDLILAVMERGVTRLVSYLAHQMDKEELPERRLARWAGGVLRQAADPGVASASRAATVQLRMLGGPSLADTELMRPLRDQLVEPVTRIGSSDPQRDADAVFEVVFGTMRRHLGAGTRPSRAEADHLVAFCLHGIRGPATRPPSEA